MPKSAVVDVPVTGLFEDLPFKKLALFFDQIFIRELSLEIWKLELGYLQRLGEKSRNNLSELEWLIERDILKTYLLKKEEFTIDPSDEALAEDIRLVDENIDRNIIPVEDEKEQISGPQLIGVLQATNEMIFSMQDISVRTDALRLSSHDSLTHFVPIVNSFKTYNKATSLHLASHFILDKIPIPNENTSWEQLIDSVAIRRLKENITRF